MATRDCIPTRQPQDKRQREPNLNVRNELFAGFFYRFESVCKRIRQTGMRVSSTLANESCAQLTNRAR